MNSDEHVPSEIARVVYEEPDARDRVELAKRQYMPGYKIVAPCPKCGAECERDMAQHYLSCPVPDEPTTEELWCATCGVDIPVRVVVRLSLEVAP
jgi:hypothetical protein